MLEFVRYHVLVSVFRLWYILVGFPSTLVLGDRSLVKN